MYWYYLSIQPTSSCNNPPQPTSVNTARLQIYMILNFVIFRDHHDSLLFHYFEESNSVCFDEKIMPCHPESGST